jgi:hypothetical protein
MPTDEKAKPFRDEGGGKPVGEYLEEVSYR